MHGVEGRRMFRPQPGEIVDVEEAAVVDGGKSDTPVGEVIGLPLEHRMQRRPSLGVATIGGEALLDNARRTGNSGERALELRRFLIRRRMAAAMAVGEGGDLPSCLALLGMSGVDNGAQDFAITLRVDRKLVLEIPG